MREFLFEKFIGGLVKVLVFFNLARWNKKIDLKSVDPRSKSVIKAAKNLDIKIFNLKLNKQQTEIFKAIKNKKSIIFKHLPRKVNIYSTYQKKIDDKLISKKILKRNKLPVSKGFCASRYTYIVRERTKKLGFPLIAKPRNGSLSKGVVRDIKNLNQLKVVLNRDRSKMMIEQKQIGKEYRVTLVNGQMIAACLREPAKIIGDGKRTIRELVNKKNKDRKDYRSATKKKIKKIKKDIETEYIPEKGEEIYLTNNINLASGAQICDLTSKVNQENKKIFEKVAELFNATIIGIDYISPDISKSYKEVGGAIIELNSLPYINMHDNPCYGKTQFVASKLLKQVFQ